MNEHAPAVLVYGNPETDAVWDPLLAELAGDRVATIHWATSRIMLRRLASAPR